MKKRFFRSILAFILSLSALYPSSAAAEITQLLPGNSIYNGRSYFSRASEGVSGYVDFAVYDTESGSEFADAPGVGKYVYAYQIFTDALSPSVLDFFGIGSMNGSLALHEPINDNISQASDSADPGLQGIQADSDYIGLTEDGRTLGIWTFDQGDFTANKHSWFLLLRSDSSWIAGGYSFDKTIASGAPIPNPEPAAIALFTIGSALMLSKRRKTQI